MPPPPPPAGGIDGFAAFLLRARNRPDSILGTPQMRKALSVNLKNPQVTVRHEFQISPGAPGGSTKLYEDLFGLGIIAFPFGQGVPDFSAPEKYIGENPGCFSDFDGVFYNFSTEPMQPSIVYILVWFLSVAHVFAPIVSQNHRTQPPALRQLIGERRSGIFDIHLDASFQHGEPETYVFLRDGFGVAVSWWHMRVADSPSLESPFGRIAGSVGEIARRKLGIPHTKPNMYSFFGIPGTLITPEVQCGNVTYGGKFAILVPF